MWIDTLQVCGCARSYKKLVNYSEGKGATQPNRQRLKAAKPLHKIFGLKFLGRSVLVKGVYVECRGSQQAIQEARATV